jgi:hypothetical protein
MCIINISAVRNRRKRFNFTAFSTTTTRVQGCLIVNKRLFCFNCFFYASRKPSRQNISQSKSRILIFWIISNQEGNHRTRLFSLNPTDIKDELFSSHASLIVTRRTWNIFRTFRIKTFVKLQRNVNMLSIVLIIC